MCHIGRIEMKKEKGSKSQDIKTLFLKKDRKSVHGRRRKWKSLETHISCGKDSLHLSKPALLVETLSLSKKFPEIGSKA